jgi:hypothetical protein
MTALAERQEMMARCVREMPDDFDPPITQEDDWTVCRMVYDGVHTINLGFPRSGDPFHDGRTLRMLRLSVWQACEMFRLGRAEELEPMRLKADTDRRNAPDSDNLIPNGDERKGPRPI